MATKRYRVHITAILDAWDDMVDIDDYAVQPDGSLKVTYQVDDECVARLKPDKVAGWFGGRFVRWVDDPQGSLDGMVIEREVA